MDDVDHTVDEPDLAVRADYEWGTLSAADVGDDPVVEVRRWLAEAQAHIGVDFNAMVLCTVDATGSPSARNVLLRELDDQGRFSFFTNRTSRKGSDIEANPRVSLLFSWLPVHRQVRVDGTAEMLDDAACDDYFASRPRDSQVAAWASHQSRVISSREELIAEVERQRERFEGAAVPRPDFWGGYAVVPTRIEMWQGRPSRLHDRVCFTRRGGAGGWVKERLAP
ncbi:MAG: pyridoxamine 5'-phosphate oxidase [Microthrixaceae bacterium]|nr:pyridoxamine 5'-phosphate oxidase [Microthrixaceae bacterium]MCO5318199.1 pyridoxamine 5'-phosphate oxidase [Microthrixaceae bacterium]